MPDSFEFLRSVPLLTDLDSDAIADLASRLRELDLREGDVLVAVGDRNQKLYLVVSGSLRVTGAPPGGEPQVLFDVHSGETVCEMALFAADAASITVQAAADATVLALSRSAFDDFCAAHQKAAVRLMDELGRLLQNQALSVALHLSHRFATLSPAIIRDLQSELETVMLYGGEELFREGDPGDALYLIVHGRLRVVLNAPDQSRTVAELGAGEIVGEMAVVSGEPRSATVVTVRDSQLARLTKDAFERVVGRHPTWGVQIIARKLAARLNDANRRQKPGPQSVVTISVIPTQPSAPLERFCAGLTTALSAFGSTLHLTSALVDQHLGRPGIAHAYERDGRSSPIIEWIAKQETEHRHVVYEADPFLSPWTERCIRQADHVLLVGDGAGDPAVGEIETVLLGSSAKQHLARQWLVLVHDGRDPSGTSRWLDVRNVERHCHVGLRDPQSYDRLARLLTGRAVGLTLGGGFARGLAHLGVFRAFEELALPVDVIGSASMGAMVGGLWCLGRDRERIMREIREACDDHFGDWTFPFVAFKRGGKFSQNVRRLFGDVQIEDLWTPFFCTSANLNRSELKIHTRGSLAKAVLASTRAPGVFPPVIYDGELHIDGGIINNVPVDLMKGFCNQGLTIGVDVAPPHHLNRVRDYGDEISGWRSFWKRCISKEPLYTPSILLVLIRTLEYTGIANQNERVNYADIFMSPEMLRFRRTDFHLADEIEQAGYVCARETLVQHVDKFHVRAGASGATQPLLVLT